MTPISSLPRLLGHLHRRRGELKEAADAYLLSMQIKWDYQGTHDGLREIFRQSPQPELGDLPLQLIALLESKFSAEESLDDPSVEHMMVMETLADAYEFIGSHERARQLRLKLRPAVIGAE